MVAHETNGHGVFMAKKTEILRVRVTKEMRDFILKNADAHRRDEPDEIRVMVEIIMGTVDPAQVGYDHITISHKPPDENRPAKNRSSRG